MPSTLAKGWKILSMFAMTLAGSASPALAGAWTLDAGTGALVFTGTAMQSTRVFDSNSRLRPIPRYGKNEAQVLIEYGLTDWLTAMVQPSLQNVDIAAPIGAQRSGLGYTDIGARARIWSDSAWVVSAQATVRIPGTFDRTNPAATGYTDHEIELRGLAGYSFEAGTLPAFVDLQVAQRYRLGGPPDEFRADVTFGVRPADKWLLLTQSFNVVSEGAGNWRFGSFAYHKFQLSAVYAITPALSLQLGGYTTYWGRNALQENGLVLGAWYKF
ncbi:hypothetical protein [Bradyrhizobium sp. USDA 4369]